MIDKNTISRIVNKIIENVKPEKIILFGSYAKGKPTRHSDLDLCVVIKDNQNIRISDIRKLFRGWQIPLDIIVYSNSDIIKWKNVKQAFPTVIVRTGKILYENEN